MNKYIITRSILHSTFYILQIAYYKLMDDLDRPHVYNKLSCVLDIYDNTPIDVYLPAELMKYYGKLVTQELILDIKMLCRRLKSGLAIMEYRNITGISGRHVFYNNGNYAMPVWCLINVWRGFTPKQRRKLTRSKSI